MAEKVLAIIPARGGSTRIKDKNLKKVEGKPLIAHAVEDALEAQTVDESIVTTDDRRIASVAKEYGGFVPFLRPDELATDDAPIAPTVTHALDWYAGRGSSFDIICLIDPTAPLRTPRDVDGAINTMVTTKSKSVISVAEFIDPPQWAVVEDDDGFLQEHFDFGALWGSSKRTQELRRFKRVNGAVFGATSTAWRKHESFYTNRTMGYEMPPERSFTIDEPWELELVRKLV